MTFLLLALVPGVAEVVAGTGPIPAIRRSLSLLTGVVRISLAEFVVLAVAVRLGFAAIQGLRALRRGEGTLAGSLGHGVLRVAGDAGVLVLLFYLLWGFQYARPGLDAHLGISATGEVSASELHRLSLASVERLNALYREVHGTDDAGVPTEVPDRDRLAAGLQAGWERVAESFDFPSRITRSHGAPKAFLATPLMKRFGVAGMHFPYTGEALVLRDLPGAILAMDLGHEMAHQRGFAREADANVMGFLVAAASDDPLARYSAHHFLHRQLVSALQRVSPRNAREVTGMREAGVARDFAHLRDYWRPAQGVVGATAARVNDAMLRSHGIPEGVANYQGSVWMLVAVAREWGEEVLFR